MEDGPLLRVDHKMTPISRRGLGQVTYFRNFGTPFITFECVKVCTDIDYEPLLRMDYRKSPKLAWPERYKK